MNKYVLKLTFLKMSKTNLILAAFGLLVGFYIILVSFQTFLKLNETVKNDKELFGDDLMVINKKVGILNTLSLAKPVFDTGDVEELKKQKFVKDIQPFTANDFRVSLSMEGTGEMPGLITDLFFESVPDEILAINDKVWGWDSTSGVIPIVFPREYLKLYNFGFASSQGLPQLSEKIITQVGFKIKIKGNGQAGEYTARVYSLTDRVNSFLVPDDFMKWANKKYGSNQKEFKPSRLAIITDNLNDPKIVQYFNEKGYETNTEKINKSRSSMLIRMVFYVVVVIGGIITVLSLLLFILSFSIIIYKSTENINRLLNIGYPKSTFIKTYGVVVVSILIIVNSISMIGLKIYNNITMYYFGTGGFNFSPDIDIQVIYLASTISVLILVFIMASLANQIKRLR